jgi:hypothetical protein
MLLGMAKPRRLSMGPREEKKGGAAAEAGAEEASRRFRSCQSKLKR